MLKQLTLHARGAVHLVHDGLVDLLPESWHRAHAGGVRLAHVLLYVVGVGVDDEVAALAYAQVSPSTLKDVGEGQEVYYAVFLRDGHHLVVGLQGGVILTVGKHDTLAVARCAAGVENVAQVVEACLCPQLLQLRLTRQLLAELQELFEREGMGVMGAHADGAIEIDYALKRRTQSEDAVCLVILLLLAHEDKLDLGIVNHILDLLLATGSIERYRHRTHAVSAEVGVEILYAILREHGDLLLWLEAEVKKGVAHLLNSKRELVP